MVVPEEFNLLDFSNVEVHINVKRMICLWFEGSSESTDRMLYQLDTRIHRMIAIYCFSKQWLLLVFCKHLG